MGADALLFAASLKSGLFILVYVALVFLMPIAPARGAVR